MNTTGYCHKSIQTRFWANLLFSVPARLIRFQQTVANAYLRSIGLPNPGSIFSFTSSTELVTLMRWAMICPPETLALEIGSHLGASAIFIAGGLAKNGGKLYCIDTWGNHGMSEGPRDTWKEFERNTKAVSKWIEPIQGFSTKIEKDRIQGKLGFVFIDGDHSYDAVRADFLHFEPLFAEDVVVAFHDSTSYEGVARWTGELLASGNWKVVDFAHSLLVLSRAKWNVKGKPQE